MVFTFWLRAWMLEVFLLRCRLTYDVKKIMLLQDARCSDESRDIAIFLVHAEYIQVSVEVSDHIIIMSDAHKYFKVAMKKGQGKEVSFKKLSAEDRVKTPQWWIKCRICKAVPRALDGNKPFMDTMWIFTWKPCGDGKSRVALKGV